ncbi:MAG: cytochrome c biogenesis protein ResB [Candidatus Omnitrophota bacterium]
MLDKIKSLRIMRTLSSVKWAVFCLLALFILVFAGTVYQAEYGLYLAQERFFNSFVFLLFGFLPFPGAQLVLWILFVNLTAAAITRFQYKWSKIGLTVIHGGILLFFISAFVTFYYSFESNLTLNEGESSNVSAAYHNWEISAWEKATGKKSVIAYDADHLNSNAVLRFDDLGFSLTVKNYYPNSAAFSESDKKDAVRNSSGISILEERPVDHDPVKNIPSGKFVLTQANSPSQDIILFGGDMLPTQITAGAKHYELVLRRKRFELPFAVKLVDFRMTKHPNTEMAKSFESTVEVQTPLASREVIISMNNPLRHNDFTFYQASYSIGRNGEETSTLAVVKNKGRVLPYIATIVTFLGLVFHFSVSLYRMRAKDPA